MTCHSTFLQPRSKGLLRIKGQKGPPDLAIHVTYRQKRHIIPFSKLSRITLKPVWFLDPTALTGHPHHSLFCLDLNLQEWFSPIDIYPALYAQGAAVTPLLNLCFARLNVPVSSTSTHNKTPSDLFLQPCQTELIFLGHLEQHLCTSSINTALLLLETP